jgi:dsRNA-specific ribonuclease
VIPRASSLRSLSRAQYLLGKGGYTKGKMDCIRQKLNTDTNLARIGRKMGLKEYIVFPNSAKEEEKITGDAYYNDTLEALVYMIHKDQDIHTAFQFVKNYILCEIPVNEYKCKNK